MVALAEGKDLNDMSFVGIIGLCDPPRVGVVSSITALQEGGVDIKMVTGDARETAEAIGTLTKYSISFTCLVPIADTLGILKPGSLCLSGKDLEQLDLSPKNLAQSVDRANVFYRVTPKHKIIIVRVCVLCVFVM